MPHIAVLKYRGFNTRECMYLYAKLKNIVMNKYKKKLKKINTVTILYFELKLCNVYNHFIVKKEDSVLRKAVYLGPTNTLWNRKI